MTDNQPHRQFAYVRSSDQDRQVPARHAVVVIGAGPVGLSLAIDLKQRGVSCVLVDDSDRIGDGSRAICFSKRTLEIFDRLGVGDAALAKGVQWKKGRVFYRDAELYEFDLLPEPGHKMPAFINIQQYYVEGYLADRAMALGIDMRWKNKLVGIDAAPGGARLTLETPEGRYDVDADWIVACDGARSPTRALLDLDFKGEQFEDQFLIADVKMTAAFPVERWFWFDPPFHAGQSALLHKQPDDVWRIDLQLSPTADADYERRPDVVRRRIEKMLGHANFELEWVSVYRFQCRRIDRFVHDRVIFAGDAAHQVSPFGARGANSGIQDAENLAWKLAAVIDSGCSPAIVQTYDAERSLAADENILNSTRATDFIAPHSTTEQHLRDAALTLAPSAEFARRMVNSGRLSVAANYVNAALSTPDTAVWSGGPAPGAALPDAPLSTRDGRQMYLSEALGRDFTLIVAGVAAPDHQITGLKTISVGVDGEYRDVDGTFTTRFAADPAAVYLVRPDTHVAARWSTYDAAKIRSALERARGHV